jgi:peptidoglycan/xylan/chitin deacetylase (PgdA/CDA1 family)
MYSGRRKKACVNKIRAGQVITKCSSPGQIALAYDDGPYQYTQRLSDILKNGGAKGTFFVTGTLYGTNPSLVEW